MNISLKAQADGAEGLQKVEAWGAAALPWEARDASNSAASTPHSHSCHVSKFRDRGE